MEQNVVLLSRPNNTFEGTGSTSGALRHLRPALKLKRYVADTGGIE